MLNDDNYLEKTVPAKKEKDAHIIIHKFLHLKGKHSCGRLLMSFGRYDLSSCEQTTEALGKLGNRTMNQFLFLSRDISGLMKEGACTHPHHPFNKNNH